MVSRSIDGDREFAGFADGASVNVPIFVCFNFMYIFMVGLDRALQASPPTRLQTAFTEYKIFQATLLNLTDCPVPSAWRFEELSVPM